MRINSGQMLDPSAERTTPQGGCHTRRQSRARQLAAANSTTLKTARAINTGYPVLAEAPGKNYPGGGACDQHWRFDTDQRGQDL